MKNLWLRLKLFCLKLWHGISDQELERALMQECIDRMRADALLYGAGISHVEPEEFYGIGVADSVLNELRNEQIDHTKLSINQIPPATRKYWEKYGINNGYIYLLRDCMEKAQDDAAKNLPIDVEEVKRHVKAARKHKKARRKRHGKVV